MSGICDLCGSMADVGPSRATSTDKLTNCTDPKCGPWYIGSLSAKAVDLKNVPPEVRRRISAKARKDFDAGLGPLQVNEACVYFWTIHEI